MLFLNGAMMIFFVLIQMPTCLGYSSGNQEILTQTRPINYEHACSKQKTCPATDLDDHADKYMEYLWCPSKLIGSMCPENSLTYYFECCGELRNKCCHRTRPWVIFIGIATPLIILAVIISVIIRKFCFPRGEQYIRGERT